MNKRLTLQPSGRAQREFEPQTFGSRGMRLNVEPLGRWCSKNGTRRLSAVTL
jgi:hypothetical protein